MKVGSKGKMLIPTVEGESFLNCFDFPYDNRVCPFRQGKIRKKIYL